MGLRTFIPSPVKTAMTGPFKAVITASILILFMASCSSHADLHPVHLRTEYKIDPVIDTRHPRLSWELLSDVRGQVQTAWQVLVASSPGFAHGREG
jgi:alpha-L-rhamnosidase